MPEKEFRGWQYLEKREPWGDRRLDFLFGMLASVIANCHRSPQTRPFKASDFITDWDTLDDRANSSIHAFDDFEAFAEIHNQHVKKPQSIN